MSENCHFQPWQPNQAVAAFGIVELTRTTFACTYYNFLAKHPRLLDSTTFFCLEAASG